MREQAGPAVLCTDKMTFVFAAALAAAAGGGDAAYC
jgi:hypothetical protein